MSKPNINGLIDYIFQHEANGNYDAWNAKTQHRGNIPLTMMTVGEVLQQQSLNPKYNAAGAVQIIRPTLAKEVRRGTVSLSDKFDMAMQRKLAASLIKRRGLASWQAGRISTAEFGTRLAKEWASLPVLQDTYRGDKFIPLGHGYYGGVATNPDQITNTSATEFSAVIDGSKPKTVNQLTAQWAQGGAPKTDTVHLSTSGQPGYDWSVPNYDPARASAHVAAGGNQQDSAIVGAPANLPSAVYRTHIGTLQGPTVGVSGLQAFGDSIAEGNSFQFMMDGLGITQPGQTALPSDLLHGSIPQPQYDPGFNPVSQALKDGYGGQWYYLSQSAGQADYARRVQVIKSENARQRRLASYDGWVAPFIGSMLNPQNAIMAVVGGGLMVSGARSAIGNAGRSLLMGSAIGAGTQFAVEQGRSQVDPNWSQVSAGQRIAGAAVATGLFTGVIGAAATPAARRALANKLMDEAANARGIFGNSAEVSIGGKKLRVTANGDGFCPEVSQAARDSGVAYTGGKIIVDEARIVSRFEQGKASGDPRFDAFKTPNELAQFEIAKKASLIRQLGAKARDFIGSESGAMRTPGGGDGARKPGQTFAHVDANGNLAVDRAGLEKAMKEGKPIRLGPAEGVAHAKHIKGIDVYPHAFRDAAHAEQAVMEAARLAGQARDNTEFKNLLGTLFTNDGAKMADHLTEAQKVKFAQAERKANAEAAAKLEEWRKENNKLQHNKAAAAISKMLDSPYKRVHTNALSGHTRDLVDTIAGDGGALRISDSKGVTVGPSVYSRAKTWHGIVRKLWDKERELYGKYLGFKSNPTTADVALNDFRVHRADGSKAISVNEFRDKVSKAYITGIRSDIPEVNEMVEHVRGAWAEYADVADEYGVISGAKTLRRQRQIALKKLDRLNDKEVEKIDAIHEQLAELDQKIANAEKGPTEDYFTRIFHQSRIRDNREAFKEKIVKPWMRQQNEFDVWELGAEELRKQWFHLAKLGADEESPRMKALWKRVNEAKSEKSGWKTVKGSLDPKALDKRADDMIDQILGEAEKEDQFVMREANRPVFGRHRQLNIPNAMLLKDGPQGNGIADFIETNYLLAHNIYAERMGPSIEMARSFARPIDGVSWKEGFDEAIAEARAREMAAWGKKGAKGKFEDHWAHIERDLHHLTDRVMNRVIRSPERWDNRAATFLKHWSQLAFMGMSATSAVQELGALVMNHGAGRIWRAAFQNLDDATQMAFHNNVVEARLAGAIMEVAQGTALSNYAEVGMDAVGHTRLERFARIGAAKYFVWNGLAPISTRLKELDAICRVHDMVERIDRIGLGVQHEGDLAELARYGISAADAKAMAQEPIFKTKEGHWQANTQAWGNEGLVRKFRAAVTQGSENTILLASAADKPIIIDGTVYLRKGPGVNEKAINAGLREVGDYWQVQSGVMSLPFQFWNYGLAAFNKILVAAVDDPSAQRLGGIASMIGLGWMVSQARTDPGQWQSLSFEDKLARAIDQSGVVGVLSNYTSLADQSSLAMTGQSILPVNLGGQRHPGLIDLATKFAGAGPSVAKNLVEGIMSGDASQTSWAMPLRNWFALKWLFDSSVNQMEQAKQNPRLAVAHG